MEKLNPSEPALHKGPVSEKQKQAKHSIVEASSTDANIRTGENVVLENELSFVKSANGVTG